MITLDSLATFFGWCAVINYVVMIVSVVFILGFRNFVRNIHSRMFGISEEKLNVLYFNYLGNYKLLVLVFNLVPYIALKLMV